jgi:hypothetical protein
VKDAPVSGQGKHRVYQPWTYSHEDNMNLKLKSLALLGIIAVVALGSGLALAAAPAGADSQADGPAAYCGELRMDEFYACQYGGWQPEPAAEEQAHVGADCGGLRTDEFYACLASGWRPDADESVRAK